MFHCFDLDIDVYFFAHTGAYQIIQAPFGTVDGGAEVATARFSFSHRALVAVEFIGFEFHRRSFAVHGQVAVNGKQFFAVEIEFGGYKTDFRVFVCIENIGRFQVLGKVVRTGLQF